jgi:type IV conjugative transfer system protein TraL
MSNYDKHYIPKSLDQEARILFWSSDVFFVGFIPIVLGVIAGFALNLWMAALGLIVGLYLGARYHALKDGKHAGVLQHTTYWVTGLPPLRGLPGSNIRVLVG